MYECVSIMWVYVVLWVWDIDQVKLIISMDTDTNVYNFMVVSWLQIRYRENLNSKTALQDQSKTHLANTPC